MSAVTSNLVNVGQVTGVFGVKGWIKIRSFTEPATNLFDYSPWWLKTAHGVKTFEIDEYRAHGKGFVAHIKDVDDRDLAAQYTNCVIAVERDLLPSLDAGEFYWHQLQDMAVISCFEGGESRLGTVKKLIETGANDVLVVAPDANSIDDRERLIPYIPDQFVTHIDEATNTIEVDWDPAF
ncbi:ribosome maturation factor RimM [Gilvimarinus polysaccharolyticus]|uniref:ribosome maturation factor RimM n=1 Tax=Gilvimarinus polysaccharolyticus TaxID=863921 RepID=UPI00067396C1|nr:ribosome maturation factor RimM [Gilvimarinus polysaccharolyticus]